MARKPDRPADPPEGGLKHNPFAALAGARPAEAAPPEVPEGAKPPREAPRAAPEAAAPKPRPAASAAPAPGAKSKGRLVLRRETKHRGGKAVVVVSGAGAIPGLDVRDLAKQLKQQLGCGGTVEDNDGEPEIILSGDRPAKVAELLRARGYRVDGVTS